jgi:hypothetical protein
LFLQTHISLKKNIHAFAFIKNIHKLNNEACLDVG